MTIVLKAVQDSGRYGLVDVGADGRICGFREKGLARSGLISAGVYLFRRDLFDELKMLEKFSFERDLMEKAYPQCRFHGVEAPGYFIDIGIPEDYARARKELL